MSRCWQKMQSDAECAKPSHSHSLANFVANFHSQKISATTTKFSPFHSQKKTFAFASEFSHSHSQLYRCDRGALRSDANGTGRIASGFHFLAPVGCALLLVPLKTHDLKGFRRDFDRTLTGFSIESG